MPLPSLCGAGVGRVSNELLLHLFHEVDLMEPSKPLLDCARKNLLGSDKATKGTFPAGHKAVHFFQVGRIWRQAAV
jgi:protein N-terminal methyltransferase